MWKKLINSKLFYIVLSVIMAVILWGYVVNDVNPSKDVELTGLPVVFQGTDLLEARSLVIIEGAEQMVDLRLKTDWNTAGKLEQSNVSLTLNVNGITEPGPYRMQADVNYPGNVSRNNISIQNDEARFIEFTVAKLVKKTIPVRARFTGSVADGYQAGEFTTTMETVEVRGLEEDVSRVAYAEAVLGQTDMDQTFEGELPLVFKNGMDEEVSTEGLQCSANSIYVIYPIVMVKELPLTVSYVTGGGATEDNIDPQSYRIEPSSIWVSGPEELLSGLKSWPLGVIDLAMVPNTPNSKFTFPIRLSEGLTNESGVTEATVTLTIKDLVVQEFEVTNIELKNIPEGYQADLVTQSRVVVLRGTQEELMNVFAAQIRIEVDLAQMSGNGVGRQTAPAKVYVDGSNVGAVGSYNIVINLKKR